MPPRHVEDLRVLDLALAPGGLRKVGKEGILVNGRTYGALNGEHEGWAGKQIYFKWDPMGDAGTLYCYEANSRAYLFVALNPELKGLSRQEMAHAATQAQRARMKARKAEMALAEAEFEQLRAEGKTPELGNIVPLPSTQPHSSPDLEALASTYRLRSVPTHQVSDERLKTLRAEVTASDAAKAQAAEIDWPSQLHAWLVAYKLRRPAPSPENLHRLWDGLTAGSSGLIGALNACTDDLEERELFRSWLREQTPPPMGEAAEAKAV